MVIVMVGAAVLLGGPIASAARYSTSGDSDAMVRIGLSVMRDDHATSYVNQSTVDTQINHLTLKGGYVFTGGFYVGGVYENTTFSGIQTSSSSNETRTGYGPAIGYFNSGFYALGTYFLSSTDTLVSGNTFTDATSSYQLEVGYTYNVLPNFYLGVGFVYDNYSWTQYTVGSTTISQTNSQTDNYPCLSLGFTF